LRKSRERVEVIYVLKREREGFTNIRLCGVMSSLSWEHILSRVPYGSWADSVRVWVGIDRPTCFRLSITLGSGRPRSGSSASSHLPAQGWLSYDRIKYMGITHGTGAAPPPMG